MATTDVTVEGTNLIIAAGGGQAGATVQTQPGPGQTDSASSSDDTTAKPKGIAAGVSYTQDSGTVRIDAADEGMQAAFVNVGGGVLTVDSGDDAINASNGDYTIEGYESADSESDDGSVLTISGGQVQLDYAGSDGINSNGSAFVTGGQVLPRFDGVDDKQAEVLGDGSHRMIVGRNGDRLVDEERRRQVQGKAHTLFYHVLCYIFHHKT